MDTNARLFVQAIRILGAANATVEADPLPVKRKLNVNAEGSRRLAKALRPAAFNVEPILLDQLASSESLLLNMFLFICTKLAGSYLAIQHVNGYSAAITAILKRMHILNGMNEATGISPGVVAAEHSYRHELSLTLNRIHGEIQTFLRTRELYLGATASLV